MERLPLRPTKMEKWRKSAVCLPYFDMILDSGPIQWTCPQTWELMPKNEDFLVRRIGVLNQQRLMFANKQTSWISNN